MLVPWGMDNLFLQVIELMLLIMTGMDIVISLIQFPMLWPVLQTT